MAEVRDRKIFAGYYRRHDKKIYYVVCESVDYDTGEPTVILQEYHLTGTRPFLTMPRKSFCEMVPDKDGKLVDKFTRDPHIPITECFIDDLEDKHLRGPVRHPKNDEDEYCVRDYQHCYSYYDYAKDIIDNYVLDRKRFELCAAHKRAIGVRNAADFNKLKNDIYFFEKMLNSLLSEYKDFFTERVIEKKSIRKYASEHNLNRGSVNHIR